MEIHRITAQRRPLDDFYRELAAPGPENGYSKIGSRMLELLGRLRTVEGPSVWAVTSHAWLNLVPGDDYRLPTLVSICSDGDWFVLEYRMPPDEAPWPDAYITGRTNDLERAVEMIRFGLQEALTAGDLEIQDNEPAR